MDNTFDVQDIESLQSALDQSADLPAVELTEFLAQGEYTLNYLASLVGRDVVARLVTGSQMGLSLPEQANYEARALEVLEASGHTPQLLAADPEPVGLPYPLLVISYLPGRPLDYRQDLEAAARCVATIHSVPVPEDHQLQEHPDPVSSIPEEADALLAPYFDWDDADPATGQALRDLRDRVLDKFEEDRSAFDDPDLAIINTDLNTHNFVVDDGYVWLLDWEKARIGPTVQDLAHFLLPTTTLWREETSTRLTSDDERRFLRAYLEARSDLDPERYVIQIQAMLGLATLRAIAWCAWSVQAAAHGDRAIINQETQDRSRMYLQPDFLDTLPPRLAS